MLEEEHTRLNQLRKELNAEFGKDLWEKSLEKQRGKGTTEDLYWWYKKQVKMGQDTIRDASISLGRKTTKGLQPNIWKPMEDSLHVLLKGSESYKIL